MAFIIFVAIQWAPTLSVHSLLYRAHFFLLYIIVFIHMVLPIFFSSLWYNKECVALIRQSASVLRVTCDEMWRRWFRPTPPSKPRPPVLFYRQSGATETGRNWYHCPLGGREPEYCWHTSCTWTLKQKQIISTVFARKCSMS